MTETVPTRARKAYQDSIGEIVKILREYVPAEVWDDEYVDGKPGLRAKFNNWLTRHEEICDDYTKELKWLKE